MILYIETKTTYFNSHEEVTAYVDALASAGSLPKDIATGIKLSGLAVERHLDSNSPAVTQHVVLDVPQVHVGPLKF